jgi:phosphate transport system substrate-binding protein
MKKIFATLLMAFSSLAFAGSTIHGAGATFPYPLYAKWATAYEAETGVKLNYQSIGSGGGIKQIKAKTVDFGASDAPLKQAELDEYGLVQFPVIAGTVVTPVNLPGMDVSKMSLTIDIISDIYLGKITKWNDPAIQALNPSLELPNKSIVPVRRADGSGTTYLFSKNLSKEFQEKVGVGKTLAWPVGVGGKGNEGVAAYIKQLPYSIGYVENAYAKSNGLPTPAIDKVMKGESFIIMYKQSADPEAAKQVKAFYLWGMTKGKTFAEDLHYYPLDSEAIKATQKIMDEIK